MTTNDSRRDRRTAPSAVLAPTCQILLRAATNIPATLTPLSVGGTFSIRCLGGYLGALQQRPCIGSTRVGAQRGNQRERSMPPIGWVLELSLFFA